MTNVIVQAITPALGTILTVLTSMLLMEIKTYVASKTKNELVNAAMDRITNTAETTVQEISQTIVNDLKKQSPDGKLTAEQSKQMKELALTKISGLLSDSVKSAVSDDFTSLGKLVESKIEQAVLKSKSS